MVRMGRWGVPGALASRVLQQRCVAVADPEGRQGNGLCRKCLSLRGGPRFRSYRVMAYPNSGLRPLGVTQPTALSNTHF